MEEKKTLQRKISLDLDFKSNIYIYMQSKPKKICIMKTKTLLIALAVFFGLNVKAQCPFSFFNNLGCGQSVDITWSFEDCPAPGSPCGSGGTTTIPWGTSWPIPCDPSCLTTCNIIITITAVNGCLITPATLDWQTALASPGGKALLIINCQGGAGCGTCCDGGNSLVIDTNTSSGYIN
jgi:hypothetical protein